MTKLEIVGPIGRGRCSSVPCSTHAATEHEGIDAFLFSPLNIPVYSLIIISSKYYERHIS